MLRRPARWSVLVPACLALAAAGMAVPAAGATTGGTIAGSAYQDLNRNGVRDSGEAALANQQLYLFDGNGAYLGTTVTDANGAYGFTGLADGDYRVEYASPSWSTLRQDWVPTTTGSIFPRLAVHLAGSATADFGWRPIVRSTTLGSPIAAYTGANGLRVESYNDAVAPSAVYATLVAGSLVGGEAAAVTIRLDYGTSSVTATSVGQSGGTYTGYAAVSYVTWGAWLDTAEQTLFHEYGHAWSLYYAFMVQQDDTLSAYVQARGLTGDSRLDSSYMWNRREMIAEDYRQLFGTAAAQAAAQMNTDIPPAVAVPGLRDFLATTFRQPPSGTTTTTTTTTAPAVTIAGLSVSPVPVSKSGTVSLSISAPAAVTVTIVDGSGAVVRTLLSSVAEPAGAVSAVWDRKDGAGRRVKTGTYTASARAVDAAGNQATAAVSFAVN